MHKGIHTCASEILLVVIYILTENMLKLRGWDVSQAFANLSIRCSIGGGLMHVHSLDLSAGVAQMPKRHQAIVKSQAL